MMRLELDTTNKTHREERDIVLLGAGSWTRSIVPLFNLEHRLLQFYDDPTEPGETWFGRPVSKTFLGLNDRYKLNAPVGDPRHKRALIAEIKAQSSFHEFISLIWMDNIIVKTARLGEGLMIQPTAKIYHNAVIGNHVSICGDGNIGHDSKIGDYCTLGPYVLLCGGVTVQEGVFLGAGCKILPNVSIGEGAVIGAGAVVDRDVGPNNVVVGVPAKNIKSVERW